MSDLISRSALLENLELLAEFQPEHKQSTILGVCATIRATPAVDAVSPGVYEQIKWERDVAIKQLEELGIGFGQKKPDMEPVRHGRWQVTTVPKKYGGIVVLCAECNAKGTRLWNFCPNCGAKMDLPEPPKEDE